MRDILDAESEHNDLLIEEQFFSMRADASAATEAKSTIEQQYWLSDEMPESYRTQMNAHISHYRDCTERVQSMSVYLNQRDQQHATTACGNERSNCYGA